MKLSRTVCIWLFASIALVCATILGFYLGSYYQRQTLYQLTGLQVERALGDLQYLRKGESQNLASSLELSIAVGLMYLPKQDEFMSNLSKSYVNRALNGANCYEQEYSWKNISKESSQIVSKNIKKKLLNEQKCL